MARLYATPYQYADVTGCEVSYRDMVRASRAVDEALLGAVYDTETSGLPSDPDLLSVLHDAAIAQAEALTAQTSQTLTPANLKSASINGVSYTIADQPPGAYALGGGGYLCSEAARILRIAGIPLGNVVTYG